MQDCDRYIELISLSLDEALSPEDARALSSHLVRCPDCMALYQDLKRIHDTMASLPNAQPPADMTHRIMAALPRGKVVPLPGRKAFRWKKWAASAAAIALVLIGAWGMSRGSAPNKEGPSPDVALFQGVDVLSPAPEDEESTTYGMTASTEQPNAAIRSTFVTGSVDSGPELVTEDGDALPAEKTGDVLPSVGAFVAAAPAPTATPAAEVPKVSANRTPVALPARQLPIYCVEQEEKRIAISFDAAWGGENTSKLLEILEEYDVKATFFLIGDWVDTYPEKVQEIADAGHEVMNHSSHHDHLTDLTREEVIADVEACNEKVEAITGVRPTLIRLPYGDYNNTALSAIRSIGMEPIQWDVDSLDWSGISADEIIQRVTSKAQPGSIILCHNSAEHTPEALPTILKTLLDEGYTFVPISQLILPGEYCLDYTIDGVGRQHAAE